MQPLSPPLVSFHTQDELWISTPPPPTPPALNVSQLTIPWSFEVSSLSKAYPGQTWNGFRIRAPASMNPLPIIVLQPSTPVTGNLSLTFVYDADVVSVETNSEIRPGPRQGIKVDSKNEYVIPIFIKRRAASHSPILFELKTGNSMELFSASSLGNYIQLLSGSFQIPIADRSSDISEGSGSRGSCLSCRKAHARCDFLRPRCTLVRSWLIIFAHYL
jgi:hypothetical protein